MSEVRTSLLSDRLGTGPANLLRQWALKAWVNFNGTGTVAIRDSENTSSITDDGAGLYTHNITNAFPDANFAPTVGGGGAAGDGRYAAQLRNTATPVTVSTVLVEYRNHGNLAVLDVPVATVMEVQ